MPNPYAPPDPSRPRPERPPAPTGASLGAEPARPPADQAGSARATGLARTAFQLMLAGIVVVFLPVPWSAASLAFTAAALVVAVRSLVVASRTRANGQVTVLALVVAGSAAVGLALGAVSLTLVPTRLAYQTCLASALTVQASTQCTNDYDARIAALTKGTSPTG